MNDRYYKRYKDSSDIGDNIISHDQAKWDDHINCEYIRFFFFKQKAAYDVVSRDWSSDVCSSDLL